MPTLKLTSLYPGEPKYYRLYTFHERPTWEELADKVEEIFSIPSKDVVLYHCNKDSQNITYSSEEELQAYYQSPFYDPDTPMHQLQSICGNTNELVALNFTSVRRKQMEMARNLVL
jgi:hypothetical protein